MTGHSFSGHLGGQYLCPIALGVAHRLSATMSGGTAAVLKQEPTQDIADERITDVSVPTVDLRKAVSWNISYDVPAGVTGTQYIFSLDQQYALGSKIWSLDQTYQRCTEYDQLVWSLDQEYKFRFIEKTLTQEYVLESGSGLNTKESFWGTRQAIEGWDFYDSFVDRINVEREARNSPPLKKYSNRNSVEGGKIAWYPSHWMGTFDVQTPESNEFPAGYRYLSSYRDDMPEWLVQFTAIYTYGTLDYFDGTGAELAVALMDDPDTKNALTTYFTQTEVEEAAEKQYCWLGLDFYWQSPNIDTELSLPAGTYYVYATVFVGLLYKLGGDGMVEAVVDQKYEQAVYDTIELVNKYQQDAFYKVRGQHEADYGINLATQHFAEYGCRVNRQHEAPIYYGVLTQHDADYTFLHLLSKQTESTYEIEDLLRLRVPHEADYAFGTLVVGHEAPYVPLQARTTQHEAGYTVDEYAYARQQHEADYSSSRVLRQHEGIYYPLTGVVAQHEGQYEIGQYEYLKKQHEAGYSLSALTKQHEAIYYPLLATVKQHEADYEIDENVKFSKQHEADYSFSSLHKQHEASYLPLGSLARQHESSYDVEQYLHARQQHSADYSSSTLARQHEAPYVPLAPAVRQHSAPYEGISQVVRQHEADYSLDLLNPLQRAFSSYYTMVPDTLALSAPDQKVVYNGVDMEVTAAVVEVSEGDVAWNFEIYLSHIADYQTIQRGDLLTVVIEGDSYEMFVSNKELRRTGPAQYDMTIRGSSPILLKAPPFSPLLTTEYTSAMSAEAIVEDLLSEAVDWQILDWVIPARRVAVTEGSPIDLAVQVVTAAGGVLESLEDGTLRVRSLFPTAVPDFDVSVPDIVLTDAEHELSYSEGYEPVTGYNKFRIRDGDVTYGDTLEYVEDEVDPLSGGVIRAYPSPWRSTTTLEHTWDSRVLIVPLGVVTRTVEEELVEFVAGQASTQHPILNIVGVLWESLPITGLTFEPHTNQITTSSSTDYGLAKITYTVQSYNYRVSQPVGTDVQYILREI